MIIETIMNALITLFTTLLSFVNIPQIPANILTAVNDTIDLIIDRSAEMIDLVLPYNIAVVLLGIVIAIELGVHIYHFIMWVLRKIPMVGIE